MTIVKCVSYSSDADPDSYGALFLAPDPDPVKKKKDRTAYNNIMPERYFFLKCLTYKNVFFAFV